MSRSYTFEDIANIKAILRRRIDEEIDEARKSGTLDELIDKYGILLGAVEELTFDPHFSKIVVFGQISGKVKDYQIRAKKLGIDPSRIEFIGYMEAKSINTEKYRFNQYVSDIIYGPAPHKLKGIEDYSSFLKKMNEHPDEYPRVIEARDNSNEGSLKISITTFESCLKKTKYYQNSLN